MIVTPKMKGRPPTCKICKNTFEIRDKEKWRLNKLICPLCGELYCTLPVTERQLRKLQDLYFEKNRDPKIFNEMIKIMKIYTASMIKKFFSKRLTFDDALDYYSHNAVSYLVEEYLEDPEFKIDISFGGFIIDKIKQVIFGKKEHACGSESLNYEFEDGNEIQYEDTKHNYIEKIEQEESRKEMSQRLYDFVIEANKFYSPRENYIRLLMINNYLSKGEIIVDKFFTAYGDRTGKLAYMKTLEILKSEIVNLIRESQ